jgi:hypothetical protein
LTRKSPYFLKIHKKGKKRKKALKFVARKNKMCYQMVLFLPNHDLKAAGGGEEIIMEGREE